MAWYALRAASESVAATQRLLAGSTLGAWGRLAVLVLFVGGLTTPFLVDFNQGSAVLGAAGGGEPVPITAVAAVVLAIGLGVLFVGSVLEFVFLDALRGEPIRLAADGRRWWRAGARLFAFRLAVLAVLGLVGWVILRTGNPRPIALLAVVPLAVALVVLDRLTVAFVVPIMFVDDRSLMAGWRAFLPTLRDEWDQYAAYLLVAGTLGVAVAVAGGLLAALLAVGFAVPFSAFGAAVAAALVERGLSAATVGRVVAVALAVPYLAVVLGTILLVHVAPVAYLRYIALFVLGDTAGRFDPIPQVRAAIRRR
jgi:hypothetical protein